MKRFSPLFIAAFLMASVAFATEKVICKLPFGTSASANTDMVRTLLDGGTVYDAGVSTSYGLTDGGVVYQDGGFAYTCNWIAGQQIVMQCTTDVNYTTGVGQTPPLGSTTAVSTTNSFFVDFTNNKDPKIMTLYPQNRVIAVQGVSDGGTCTFGSIQNRSTVH